MKRPVVAWLLLAAALAAWAQDEGTTSLTFVTRDDRRVPVYELKSAGPEPAAGYLPLNARSPTFVAPTVLDVDNGLHAFQLGTFSLFATRFDVQADGTPQTWRLDAGNPALYPAGWGFLFAGILVAAVGVNDWQSSSPLLFKSSDASLVELVGALIGGGGVALILTTRPSASRVR